MSPNPDGPEAPPPANWFAGAAILLGLASLVVGLGTVGPAIVFGLLGVWHARRYGDEKWPALLGIGLASAGAVLHVAILPAWSEHQDMLDDSARQGNVMTQIAIALEIHKHERGTVPSACYQVEPDPPPDPSQGWSWRFGLLPYLEQEPAFRAIKADQPWDSPANRLLTESMPVFADNYAYGDPLTRYRVFHGNGAALELHRPVKPEEITDGAANTVLFVQAGQQVPWPQCNELPFDPAGPLPPLGRPGRNWFLVAMADGSVRTVRKNVDPAVMEAAITRAGGEPPPDW